MKINKYINKLLLFGGSTSTECFLVYLNPGRIGIWKCWFLRRGENRRTDSLRSKRFRLVSEQKKTEERDFRFWPREKWNESQKMKEGGGRGGGEGRKRLQTDPSILKTCVRQQTQRLIGSASRTILTCVDQRFISYWEVMYGTWHASSCGCCLFWSARFTLQCKSIFFSFFWNVKPSCDYIRVSDV